MKQILNQRYTYKIKGSYLKRYNLNIKISDIKKAKKNRFIVGVGDSNGFRMIRDITDKNNTHSEEYINLLKDKIRKSKDKIKIKNMYKELDKSTLEEHICNVVFSSEKQYDEIVKKGFTINKIKYTLLLGTTGGVKNNTAMFIDEKIYDEIMRRIYNGFNKEIPMLPSKLMSYMALLFSSSTPVINTEKILVVHDTFTHFNETVTRIEEGEGEEPNVYIEKDKEIEVNSNDGCGLITSELSDKWRKCLQSDEDITSYCVRYSWVKGMLTTFDFKKYCKEELKQEIVTDVWGNKHNINDIDIILNESMLKCYKGYSSIEEYNKNCKENGYCFAVTKTSENNIDKMRTLNYQYIQCLDLNDDNINELLKNDINEIKDTLGLDYRKSILFGKGTELNDDNVWIKGDNDLYFKSLMINKECINDEYIKYRIKSMISKRIKQLKTGKIKVEGNYQIAIGEPIIQLQSMFGLEPKGLLKSGEFFNKYWNNRGVNKVGTFRSPMSCKSNARIMNICDRDEVKKWYGNLNGVIIFNAWDTTMMACNGEDFDGDLNFTTSNSIILNGIFKDEYTIDCDSESGEKKSNITRQDFINCIKKSFGNKVGSITNVGSSCYDKIALFDKDSEEYKVIDKRIKSIQYLQQSCIDSVKNGKPPKPVPKTWNDFHSLKIEETDNEETRLKKEFNRRIVVDKKPYYFRYIYETINKEYEKFIKQTNINCARRFRCTVEDLKSKDYLEDDEKEFLLWYEKKNPLSNNPCIVNKIAWRVENEFDRNEPIENKEFDYSIYLSENKEIATKNDISKIKKLYEEYKKNRKNQVINTKDTSNKDSILQERKDKDDILKREFKEIIQDNQILLNTLIDLSYRKNIIGKWVVWNVCGETILDNMLNNTDRIIKYPIKDKNGEFEYNGIKFSMKELKIEEEEIIND